MLIPSGADRFDHLKNPESLPDRMREEIEQFFLNTIFFTPKNARILGWKGPKYADKLIARAENGGRKR